MSLNAVVRIRGAVKVRHDLKMALEMLNLHRVNWMTLVKDDPASLGQLAKVKDLATFGQVDSGTLSQVLEKRGGIEGDKKITKEFLASKGFKSFEELANALVEGKTNLKLVGIKPVFRLHPPKKGHERGGIKKPFILGGALGSRGQEINELIGKMV